MEQHRYLKRVAHTVYRAPGMRRLARHFARSVIQRAPMSLKNRYRTYNFFAEDTSPTQTTIFRVQVPGDGTLRLALNLRNHYEDLSRIWYFWGYDGYERATTRFLTRLLPRKKCVFDIGSNIGYYALLAASLMSRTGEVHAFEPVPSIFHVLQRNARLNKFLNLYLNQAAVSNKDGKEQLFLPIDLGWSSASLIEGITLQTKPQLVTAISLSTYCAQRNIEGIDLLRIDAEGAELKVLSGLGDLLDIWLPDIVCEILPGFEHELQHFLGSKPYRKFLLTDRGPVEVEEIRADPKFRDYYLSPNGAL